MLWALMFVAVFFAAELFSFSSPSFACTTVLVGKDASETGEVLVGHNEDSGGRYVMRTHIVPPERRSGAAVRFEPDTAVLPLPDERPKLFWSEARPFIADGGASFCDFYINGYGVVLCSDNCGKSREGEPELTDGGIGYGVRRLTSELARSAYNAVEVASGFIDKYGYTGSGRSYHFADKNEIWVLQAVNGKHYAVKRLEDNEIYVNPNHYTIRQPDSGAPGFEKLTAYATLRGWYDPEKEKFDFARVYQAPGSYRSVGNIHRHRRGFEIALGRSLDLEDELPFSAPVKPSRKIGVEDIKKILRCHFEGTPEDVSGPGGGPHFMETRPMCASTTLESTIVQIRENHDMTLIWRAQGRPCLSIYSPWYFGITEVPAEYAGTDPETAVKTHFSVPAADLGYSKSAAWFHYTDLQAAIDPLYGEKAAEVRRAIADFEEALQKEVRCFEPLAQKHFKTEPSKARELLTAFVASGTARALQKLDELYANAGVLTMGLPEKIDVNETRTPFLARLDLQDVERRGGVSKNFGPGDLVLENTLFGPHYAPRSKWSKALSAAAREGKLCLSFTAGEWVKRSVPCLTDMWLILENRKGERLVGKGLATLTGEAPPVKNEAVICACDCA